MSTSSQQRRIGIVQIDLHSGGLEIVDGHNNTGIMQPGDCIRLGSAIDVARLALKDGSYEKA